MTRYAMVVDVTKCNGCYNCFIACKDEHCGIDHLPHSAAQPMTGHSWMKVIEKERGRYPKVKVDYIAIPCMQCENPSCAAPDPSAVHKREDGIVIVDPEKAAGNRDVVSHCPYRAIYWNDDKKIGQKCTFCAHLLDAGWKEPRCVEACPTGTLIFGDLDDPDSEVSKLFASGKTEALVGYNRGEKVRYVGLPREFVAGAVVFGDKDECAKGLTVTLEGAGGTVAATATTDAFGDFEFEGLPANTVFTVKISAPGYTPWEAEVKTSRSINLGDIVLESAR
jgi:Fe-S-cluster-containing dehydrogenase component